MIYAQTKTYINIFEYILIDIPSSEGDKVIDISDSLYKQIVIELKDWNQIKIILSTPLIKNDYNRT